MCTQELRWRKWCSSLSRICLCPHCWCPGGLVELDPSFGDPVQDSCLLFLHCRGVKVTRSVTCEVKTEKVLYPTCKNQDEIASLGKQKGPCSRTVQICKRHPVNLAGGACDESNSCHRSALPQLQNIQVWPLGGDEPQLLKRSNLKRE